MQLLCNSMAADCVCVAGPHDLKASGSKVKQSAHGLCKASSEASEPGEGGGLRRSKKSRIGGDEVAHGWYNAVGSVASWVLELAEVNEALVMSARREPWCA